MANQQEHTSIYLPKYETTTIQFVTPTSDVSVDIGAIQNYIREKAEANLEQCKSFEVSLPSSITGITSHDNGIEFKSLFQTPALNELEMLSTNSNGSPIRLNDEQLEAVKQTGEFEVNSIHFPGQKHRWKLNRLLQSGIQIANKTFFQELSYAVYMLIFFARDRICSNAFSFKATLRSWRQGLASILDAFIGLPAIYYQNIDFEIENERNKFLVNELLPHEREKQIYESFSEQVPVLLKMMEEHEKSSSRKNPPCPPQMLPYPHHFVTRNNVDIDLRLHNDDLQTMIETIISSLLPKVTPKNWFNITKRRLINEYKHRQMELGLSKQDIAKRVQSQLNTEYTERVFEIIENSKELAQLSPGLGRLLVAQVRSILIMRSVVEKLTDDLEEHMKTTRNKFVRENPIRSQISRWLEEELFREKVHYIRQHEWDLHQLSIEQCQTLGNQQAAYFIQRDLTFRKDVETTLRLNLKSPREPIETINCERKIWFRKNYIIERISPLPIQRIPTQFAKDKYSSTEEEDRIKLICSDSDAKYQLRRSLIYSTTTRYPFWRWKLFFLRTYCWISNAIFFLCLAIPFASPVSFRALFSLRSFQPNYELNPKDLKLHQIPHSNTHTFISRLVALWNNIRESRTKFEQTPDRGFLGKNIQRLFNRVWNYFAKGVIGSTTICLGYPVSCLTVSIGSFIVGVLSPIWMPIVTLGFHILQILFYDAYSAGEYSRKFFCLINILFTDILLCGIIQPVLVLSTLIASPIVAVSIVIYALLHRCTAGIYDEIIYRLVVKRRSRIPAHDSFLARRTAGPGLAAEYFYQVSSPEVLAALESLIEQNELIVYRSYVDKLLNKPIDSYRSFFNSAFQPFAAKVQTTDNESIFSQMNDLVNKHIQDLKTTIENRFNLLEIQRGVNHNRIRLTESDLTAVLIEGSELVEELYPNRILPYLNTDEIEKFWNDHDLTTNDWFGLTSKLLQELFSQDFLTPLEQTDVFYSLQIDHLTLSKYAHMINSTHLRDDLDAVTSVYLPETSNLISPPSFDQIMFNPNKRILDLSTNYFRSETHGRIYRYFNRTANYLKHEKKFSRFVDYTSITCRFSIPIRLPEVICVNTIIFNRDNNNSSSTTSIKNDRPLEQIVRLIDFNKKFYKQPMLPTDSTMIPSITTVQTTINNDININPEHSN